MRSTILALAVLLAACGSDPQAPVAEGTIPAMTLAIGDEQTVELAKYFSDADGDALTYTAKSAMDGVATAVISGESVKVTGQTPGTSEITVTASDPGGLTADQKFTATVTKR